MLQADRIAVIVLQGVTQTLNVQPDISPPSSDFVEECRREEQNCLRTAASLHIWARFLRVARIVFIVFPLILGAIAGWSVLEQAGNALVQAVVSFVALVEGVIPALFASLKIDGRVDESVRLEAEYTNLGDRFRQAALNASHKSSSECEMEFRPLMKRLEVARGKSPVPDWCVKRAEAKLKHGHYDRTVSEAA